MRRLDIAQMLRSTPPPIPWVMEPLCARQNVTLLTGQPGAGKSILASAIAGAVDAGRDLAGLRVGEMGRVLYFDAENGENTIHQRVHLLNIAASVEIWEPNGLSLGRNLAQFEDTLILFKPVLVVVDSLRSIWPEGDENDSGSTEKFLAKLRDLARKYDCAILVLHHLSKGIKGGYRGSTAIGAGVQVIASLRIDDRDDALRVLEWSKCRMREMPRPVDLKFVNLGSQLRITNNVADWAYNNCWGDA